MARDPYRYFRIEARELVDQLGQAALDLEKGTAGAGQVTAMLRVAHTLKGAARVVKERAIADQAHAIEDALAEFRDGRRAVPQEVLAAVVSAVDVIGRRLATLAPAAEVAARGEGADRGDTPGSGDLNRAAAPSPAVEEWTAHADEVDALLEGLGEARVQLEAVRNGVGMLEQTRRLALVDHELVQAREAAERMRLTPARLMFLSLERAARDAAQSLGKRVEFTATGGEVRLDGEVFSGAQSALTQAVRNAVAHGIEPPAEREAAGKAAQGRVSIEVRQIGHEVAFSCRDDGRGVNFAAVRRALEREERIGPGAGDLGTEELLELLLRGGITTSAALTQVAGRGLGLDIVREAASRLRGRVDLRTAPGRGTVVEIIVPVSLAALRALIVESGRHTVAIPLEAVKRTLRLEASDLAHTPHGASIAFEGSMVPFVPLERALTGAPAAGPRTRPWLAVIVEGSNARAAAAVERLLGTQDLIVRSLPALAPAHPFVAGAFFDAAGHPRLVLDPQELVTRMHRMDAAAEAVVKRANPILVIDDSLTTRMLEQSILESAGYEVELAVSAEDALERARGRRHALFLVDVEMPGMDGFTFIERARADPALKDTPAILVTSRASPDDRRRGLAAGARAYIVKGEFDQSVLLESIRSLVGA